MVLILFHQNIIKGVLKQTKLTRFVIILLVFFGVGSVNYDCDSEIYLSTGEIFQQGEKIDNMEDFYGCIDEDETWVIGCHV